MTFHSSLRSVAVGATMAIAAFSQAGFAHAGNHLAPPGIQPCFNPGGCHKPPVGGGGVIMPPAPPGPGGGGGGGGGPFGNGLATGIGAGVGFGIVNALTRPRQPQVVVQPQPTYVRPAPVQVAPQPVSQGLSAHDQYCLGKYKSYNIQTKRFMSYSGQYKLCISPYM